MAEISPSILVITINVNGNNLPIHRQRSQIGKNKSVIHCVQEVLLKQSNLETI